MAPAAGRTDFRHPGLAPAAVDVSRSLEQWSPAKAVSSGTGFASDDAGACQVRFQMRSHSGSRPLLLDR